MQDISYLLVLHKNVQNVHFVGFSSKCYYVDHKTSVKITDEQQKETNEKQEGEKNRR